MSPRQILTYAAILVAMGAGWGATQPMTKIAVSTGYGHFGLVFWQMLLGSCLMLVVCLLRGKGLTVNSGTLRLYGIIALVGTVFPNTLSYQAAVHLPSGIMSLLISSVPMFAFVIALGLGNEQFKLRRLIGLGFGLIGVLLIVVPDVEAGGFLVSWAGAYLLVAMFYAFEGNYVARWGTQGLDPFQVMLGASLVGLCIITPLMLWTDQFIAPVWPMPAPQYAHVAGSIIHVLVYATYVWLVGRAGAVFAVQVSYLVTGFGLMWAWLILGEALTPIIWAAVAAMFVGMYFVQPRVSRVLAGDAPMGDTAP